MVFSCKKIIKFFLIVLLFNLNITCFSMTLLELLNVDSYNQIIIDLFSYPLNELKDKELFGSILQQSIEFEEDKLNNPDSWYTNTYVSDDVVEEIEYPGSETDEISEPLYYKVIDKSYIEKYDLNLPDEKIIIIGDLHGNFDALNNIIIDLISRDILTENLIISEDYKIICLGDFIDRGNKSLETMFVLMLLRLLNLDSFILLAGNHENPIIFNDYGFRDELISKFVMFEPDLIDRISNSFELLPNAYFVRKPSGKLIQFSHAGWSNLENERDFLSSDKRFFRISDYKSTELLWNDIELSGRNVLPSDRGAGKKIGILRVVEEMEKFNVVKKFGGHQHSLPKNGIEIADFSPGFIRLSQEPSVFVLISGSINYGSKAINYYPSYLELVGEEVFGYFQYENHKPFVKNNLSYMPFITSQV